MSCACIDVWVDEPSETLLNRIVDTEVRVHCCECDREVDCEPVEIEVASNNGDIDTYITCMDCISVRENLFCGGWYYRRLWVDIEEHVSDMDGQISSDCLLSLTDRARFMLIDLIQSYWDEDEDEDEELPC